jgi:hypothetical protein
VTDGKGALGGPLRVCASRRLTLGCPHLDALAHVIAMSVNETFERGWVERNDTHQLPTVELR